MHAAHVITHGAQSGDPLRPPAPGPQPGFTLLTVLVLAGGLGFEHFHLLVPPRHVGRCERLESLLLMVAMFGC